VAGGATLIEAAEGKSEPPGLPRRDEPAGSLPDRTSRSFPVRQPIVAALLSLVLSLPAGGPADKESPQGPKATKANRLARETSPYLLQHAHNPVDWYPWGPEAFSRAKKENKLVFLSIGYSSCHWCHVMEKESFARADVAKILNEHFICIKVDREERPEIDHIYMEALHALKQRGGWPLSMFLTPEGKPIIGGTYWPRENRELSENRLYLGSVAGGTGFAGRKGRLFASQVLRGFKSVLHLVADTYKKHPKEVLAQGDQVARDTKLNLEGHTRLMPLFDLGRDLLGEAVDELQAQFDKVHGGFGDPGNDFAGTKFPTTPRLLFLEEEAARTKSPSVVKLLDVTLDHMARGGIYDHLGGGFHRYSTEHTWTVPHFEKMLYDNAQLVELYALAWQRTRAPQYRRVIDETLAFVTRELTSPEGVFYSALDADSEGEEGRFYVWTDRQIAALLPDKEERDLLGKVYGLDGPPNFEEKYRILTLPEPLAVRAKEQGLSEAKLLAKLAPLKKRFFAERAKRPRPFLDTKVLTSWNGEMIAGFAVAGRVLGEKQYLERAAKAADFLLRTMKTRDGRLLRNYGAAPGGKAEARVPGYLDDYAFLVHGLLCLHDATREKRWLDEARALTDTMVKYHFDEKAGGFFYTASDHEELFVRAKDQYDGAQPCGNSMAARNLVRLWQKTSDAKYKRLAEKTFRALALPLKSNPSSLTTLASAIGLYLDAKK
jgi:uncharacterized protein YyaL (SSP411 family)